MIQIAARFMRVILYILEPAISMYLNPIMTPNYLNSHVITTVHKIHLIVILVYSGGIAIILNSYLTKQLIRYL